jgi:SnoaL-like domain
MKRIPLLLPGFLIITLSTAVLGQAPANTEVQAREDLERIYKEGRVAFAKKDAAYFEKVFAPNFTSVGIDGTVTNRAQQLEVFKGLVAGVKQVKQSLLNIQEVRLTNDGFVAVFSENDWFEFAGANNQTYSYLRLATVQGTFVRQGNSVQEVRVETLREQINLVPTVASRSPITVTDQDKALVADARAQVDALYKGDYNRAWVNKDPSLLGKHFAPTHVVTNIDGTTNTGVEIVEFVRGAQRGLDRVVNHTVSIDDVTVSGNRIYAVVTNNLVLQYTSPTGQRWVMQNSGTFRDGFERTSDGLKEISAQHLGQLVVSFRMP